MSTVSEIVAEVEKMPKEQRNELFLKLAELGYTIVIPLPKRESGQYRVKALPLGYKGDKLPSHMLADLEEEEFIEKHKRIG